MSGLHNPPSSRETESADGRVGWLQREDGSWEAVDEDGWTSEVDEDDTLPHRLVDLCRNKLWAAK